MALSNDLITKFVKTTNDVETKKTQTTLYGKAVVTDQGATILLDGAESPTPCEFAVNVINGDRVTVTIEDHKAVVTGNITNPNLSTSDVISASKENPGTAVMQGVVITDSTLQNVNLYGAYSVGETLEDAKIKGSYIDGSTFENGTIKGSAFVDGTIEGSKIKESTLTNSLFQDGTIEGSKIKESTITNSLFQDGTIEGSKIKESTLTNSLFQDGTIEGSKINASTFIDGQISGSAIDVSKFTNGTISASVIDSSTIVDSPLVEAIRGEFDALYADKASITGLDAKYADIDAGNIKDANITKFVSNIGIINDATIKDGKLTGKLAAVEIDADYITSGTLATDRLLVKGTDGLYYSLNVNALGEAAISSLNTEEQEKLKNGIHGSNIIAKTITASSISCSDLSAFEATIGGFNITENSLYSGVKSSVGNQTRGVYLDNTGQFSFGDTQNFITYYKTTDDTWKLAICADTVELGNGITLNDVADDVQQAVSDAQTAVDAVNNLEIGGRNLYFGTQYFDSDKWDNLDEWQTWDIDEEIGFREYGRRGTWQGLCQQFYPEIGQTYTLSFWARGYDGASINVYASWDDTSVTPSCIELGPVTDEYVRYSATFTANVDTDIYPRVENTVDGAWLQIYGLKLEKGNKATDWTAAPEDIELATSNEISNTTKDVRSDLSSAIESTSSELIDKIDANYDAVNEKIDNFNRYVRFVNGTIVLGETGNELVLTIQNDRVSFTQSGVEVAFFSDDQLYIKRAEVLTTLKVGNYEFAPRNDGGLALRKIIKRSEE